MPPKTEDPGFFETGAGSPVEHRLVDVRAAGDDDAVGRQASSGHRLEDVSPVDELCGDIGLAEDGDVEKLSVVASLAVAFAFVVVFGEGHEQRPSRRERQQRRDGGPRPPLRARLEPFTQQDERQQHGRGLEKVRGHVQHRMTFPRDVRHEVMLREMVVQHRRRRVEVGGRRPQGDQHIHIGPPRAQSPDGSSVEPPPARAKLNWGRETPFQQLIQRKTRDHRRHQRVVEFWEKHRHKHCYEVDGQREHRRLQELGTPPPHVGGDGRGGPGPVGADRGHVAGHPRDLEGGPDQVSRSRRLRVEGDGGRGRERVDVDGRDPWDGE